MFPTVPTPRPAELPLACLLRQATASTAEAPAALPDTLPVTDKTLPLNHKSERPQRSKFNKGGHCFKSTQVPNHSSSFWFWGSQPSDGEGAMVERTILMFHVCIRSLAEAFFS